MKHKYIGFIPTPRAASASLTHALASAGIYDPSGAPDIPSQNGFFLANSPLSGQDKLFPRWWDHRGDVFLFTVLRNPYDRVASAYLHSLRQEWIPSFFTLPDFCDFLARFAQGIYNDLPGGPDEFYEKWSPEAFVGQEVVRMAFNHAASWECGAHTANHRRLYSRDVLVGLCAHCFFDAASPPFSFLHPVERPHLHKLRFENLQADVDELVEKLGWPPVELPHLHRSRHTDYRTLHTPVTEAFVQGFYCSELAAGKYEPPSAQRIPGVFKS